MTNNNLRTRVYQAADELFIETGSLHSVGQRAVRDRAKGGSNDVGPLLDDWRASREAMLNSRPAALAAIAEEFAGRLWLMAQLLSRGSEDGVPPRPVPPPPIDRTPTARSAARTQPPPIKAPAAPATAQTSQRRDVNKYGAFSDIARPERPAVCFTFVAPSAPVPPAPRGRASLPLPPPRGRAPLPCPVSPR